MEYWKSGIVGIKDEKPLNDKKFLLSLPRPGE